MEKWVVSLTIGGAAADVQQCYPAWAIAGTNPAVATTGQLIRQPCEGQLESLQVMSDGVNAGVLELYDISGIILGVDVSSATAITDAVLDAAITAGTAKLILNQNFDGAGFTPWAPVGPARFMKGLAARAVGAGGTCSLNLTIQGGYRYLEKGG